MFTQPFLIPDLPSNDRKAMIYTSLKLVLKKDKVFKKEVDLATKHCTYIWQEQMQDEVSKLRDKFINECDVNDNKAIQSIANLPIHEWILLKLNRNCL